MRRAREVLLALLLMAVLAVLLPGARAGPGRGLAKLANRKFVPFETATTGPQQGSIINIPTNCPESTRLIGNKCRRVYG